MSTTEQKQKAEAARVAGEVDQRMSAKVDARLRAEQETSGQLNIYAGSRLIAEYHYAPDTPLAETPKPYFHPLRSLDGTLASAFRPADHRWHKGLAMTWSEVSGQNFWGGPTFDPTAPGHGYVWKDNIGRQVHEGFDRLHADEEEVMLDERVAWITQANERWLDEQRHIRIFGADLDRGVWAIDFDSSLTNVSDETLQLGSPTTLGRENAGYTGLFWRGPRSWAGENFQVAGHGEQEQAMGVKAHWVAIGGDADEVDGAATLLMYEANADRGPGTTWFARTQPFAALSPSPAFDQIIELPPRATLHLDHRVLVLSGRRGYADLVEIAADYQR